MALSLAPYLGMGSSMLSGPGLGMMAGSGGMGMYGAGGMGMYGPGGMGMMGGRGPFEMDMMQDPLMMALRSGMMRPPLSMSLEYEDLIDYPRRPRRRGLLRRSSYGNRSLWDDDFDGWDDIDPDDLLTLLLRRGRGRGSYRCGRPW